MWHFAYSRFMLLRLLISSVALFTVILLGYLTIDNITAQAIMAVCFLLLAIIYIIVAGLSFRFWRCKYILSKEGIEAVIGKEKIELLWKNCRYFGWIICPQRGNRILYFSSKVKRENGRFRAGEPNAFSDGERFKYGPDYLTFMINEKQWKVFQEALPSNMLTALLEQPPQA